MTDKGGGIEIRFNEFAKLAPFTEAPNLLGGGAQKASNNKEAHSTYCSLERLVVLPPARKAVKIENEEVRHAYNRMCNGDFFVRWSAEEDKNKLSVQASFEERFEDKFDVTFILTADKIEGNLIGNQEMQVFFQPHSAFKRGLNGKQQTILLHRILHQLLRFVGALLPFSIVRFACRFTFQFYSARDFVEALDIVMTEADIALTQQQSSSDIALSLCMVAPALEVLGRHCDAALVHYEVAEIYEEESSSELEKAYRHSGFAFITAGDYERAEEAYIKALHANFVKHGNRLNFLDGYLDMLFNEVMALYTGWVKKPSSEVQGSVELLLTVGATFMFLAATASATMMNEGTRLHCNNIRPHMKEKFRGMKQAKRALEEAILFPTVQHFRETVVACQDPNSAEVFQARMKGMLYMPLTQAMVFGTSRQRQDYAQNWIQNAHGEILYRCGNPACGIQMTRKEMKMCPCKSMHYCQKSCQVTHWHEAHKRECRYQEERKKKKAKKEKRASL